LPGISTLFDASDRTGRSEGCGINAHEKKLRNPQRGAEHNNRTDASASLCFRICVKKRPDSALYRYHLGLALMQPAKRKPAEYNFRQLLR
jgi:hypothetical protein